LRSDSSIISGHLSTLGRLMRLPLRLIPPSTRLRVLTGPLRGRRWVAGSGIHGCWLGTYERTKLELFQAALRAGDVVYDIGANVGVYSLAAAFRVGPAGHVYAFEPVPRNVRYLLEHLSLNHVDNCTVLDVAVSSAAGLAAFDEGAHPSTGRLITGGTSDIMVRTVTLDALVESRTVSAPSIVKLDIEGSEYDALVGMSRTLRRARPIIFIATHSDPVHGLCCALLERLDFDLRPIDGAPISEATEIIALPR
jgi:FkbM family methyltransferase